MFNVFFPPFCVGCGAEGKYLCEKCYVFAGEASLICPACDGSSFSGQRHKGCPARYGLDGLANAWEYEGLVKKLVGAIKYQGITHAAQEFMRSSFWLMAADQARFGPFFAFLFMQNPVIAYVPMFIKKEKRRGFNQARLIANEIARIGGKQAKVARMLKKIRDTDSQTELNKAERAENIKDSFEFCAKKEFAKTKSAVLVDDIWTTGATMRECCRVLKRAGVKNVWGFTLARTP